MLLRSATEALARKTTRRGLLGRGTDVAFGALLGVAAGGDLKVAMAGGGSVCAPAGPQCPCEACQPNGVCAKPCVFWTGGYASGCWVTQGFTCCDCDCNGKLSGYPELGNCGCSADYHGANCPEGTVKP